MTTKPTEPDLITEVETLLNDVGFSGDFETVSRPLLRRLVGEVKTQQRYYESAVADFAVEMNTVRAQLAQAEKELATTKQHRDDLIEELERERKIPNRPPSMRLGIK